MVRLVNAPPSNPKISTIYIYVYFFLLGTEFCSQECTGHGMYRADIYAVAGKRKQAIEFQINKYWCY